MNANLPTLLSIPDVPGIDDCHRLFNISSKDGTMLGNEKN